MAVLTPDGTLRGYQSQCVDVSSPLQTLMQLVRNQHCVLSGLGPEGEDHLIINKVSGGVNRMGGGGVNYLQDSLVVPPEFLNEVVQDIHGTDQAAPFGRQE